MKYYQVFSKREYVAHGQDKVRWLKVGEIKVTDNGGKYLKLNHLPNIDFVILPELDDDSEDVLAID